MEEEAPAAADTRVKRRVSQSAEEPEAKESKQKHKDDKDKELEMKKLKQKDLDKRRREADFRQGQRTMMVLLLKQVLRTSQQTRDLLGCVVDAVVVETEGSIYKDMQTETTNYVAMIKTTDKKDKVGPPHIKVCSGILTAINKDGQAVGKKTAEAIVQYMKEYEGHSTEQKCDLVKLCKAEKMWKSSTQKIYISLADRELSSVLLKAMDEMGAERKQGRMPPTFRERELQLFVGTLDGWAERMRMKIYRGGSKLEASQGAATGRRQ